MQSLLHAVTEKNEALERQMLEQKLKTTVAEEAVAAEKERCNSTIGLMEAYVAEVQYVLHSKLGYMPIELQRLRGHP